MMELLLPWLEVLRCHLGGRCCGCGVGVDLLDAFGLVLSHVLLGDIVRCCAELVVGMPYSLCL
jgi:hypothetical protein